MRIKKTCLKRMARSKTEDYGEESFEKNGKICTDGKGLRREEMFEKTGKV